MIEFHTHMNNYFLGVLTQKPQNFCINFLTTNIDMNSGPKIVALEIAKNLDLKYWIPNFGLGSANWARQKLF